MILARKLRSALRLYRSGGLSTVAELAWVQSRGYIESNSILPRGDAQRARLLTRIFNDRVDYPHVDFDVSDARSCRPSLLIPYLRRQFFDVVRLADLRHLQRAEIPLVADALYRRWDFPTLDAHLSEWGRQLAGTPASVALHMMARRVALRLGRLGEAGVGLVPSGGDIATCLLRAEVFDAQNKLPEATRAFEEALRKQSDHALVRLPYAFHLLKVGRSWEGLENWGVADGMLGTYPLRKRRRRWRGESLHGLTLMVIFEHGLGDMIQMSRFLHALRAAHPGGTIVGRVPKPLVGLLERSFPSVGFVPSEEPDPAYDLYVPSMQLPLVVGAKTLEPTTNYLRLEPPSRVPCATGRPRIGICWRGHPRQYEQTRSIPLDTFARLFSREDADFIVLLNTPTPQETAYLDRFPNVLRPPIDDFTELGRLIASCDLVVSVDTAITHVAGAAGMPTLLLSRPDACWRWGPGGSRSPWYETVEVLRHPGDMDWPHVLAQADRRIGEVLAPTEIAAAAL